MLFIVIVVFIIIGLFGDLCEKLKTKYILAILWISLIAILIMLTVKMITFFI